MAGDRVNEGYRRWVSPLQARPRRLQDRLGAVRAGAVDQPRRPAGRDDPRRRHPGGDDRGRGAPRRRAGSPTSPTCWRSSRPWSTRPGRPDGGHIFWAYVHVPHGSDVDMTEAIENQVERFAPGFRDTVVERVTKNAVQMEAVEPQPHRWGHLQRRGVAPADAGPPGAAVEHLQDAGRRASTSPPRRPRPAPRCTGRAVTTRRRWRCARCSACARSRRCGPRPADRRGRRAQGR